MDQAGRYRWVFSSCALLLLFVAGAVAATGPSSNDPVSSNPAQLLQQAENVEPSNHAEFNELMGRLDKVAMSSHRNRSCICATSRHGEIAFAGHYAAALPSLKAIADQTADPVLAFRARATVIDLLVAQSRYGKPLQAQSIAGRSCRR